MTVLLRRLAWFIAGITLLAAGGYVFVYLVVWEWHRAILAALLFLAVEVAFTAGVVVRSRPDPVRAVERARIRVDRLPPQPSAVPTALPPARPPAATQPFAWLEFTDRHHGVFIPILLGGGVVISGVAWLLEKVAGQTAGEDTDQDLPAALGVTFPAELVVDDAQLLAQDPPYTEDARVRLLVAPQP